MPPCTRSLIYIIIIGSSLFTSTDGILGHLQCVVLLSGDSKMQLLMRIGVKTLVTTS